MRVLVACEFSGVVRDAFRNRGHDAWSVDLLPSEGSGVYHWQGDVRSLLGPPELWDLMIAFPPCTHLAVSGARWFKGKEQEQAEAVEFVRQLMAAPIPRIAIENPIGVLSTKIRKPDQIIQPWQFGHGEVKATCLWLKNLPKLQPTQIVEGRTPRVHHASPGPDRWKERSRTLQGIAEAMADQWGDCLCVCGHPSADHLQFEGGEMCQFLSCYCQWYRKAADSHESTAILSAGGSPEGLARETVAPPVNEAAERLRIDLGSDAGILARMRTAGLDAALATERRNTVERIRDRVAVVREGGYSVETNLPVILDEVAS